MARENRVLLFDIEKMNIVTFTTRKSISSLAIIPLTYLKPKRLIINTFVLYIFILFFTFPVYASREFNKDSSIDHLSTGASKAPAFIEIGISPSDRLEWFYEGFYIDEMDGKQFKRMIKFTMEGRDEVLFVHKLFMTALPWQGFLCYNLPDDLPDGDNVYLNYKKVDVTISSQGIVYGSQWKFYRHNVVGLVADLILEAFQFNRQLQTCYKIEIADNPYMKDCWSSLVILHLFSENRVMYCKPHKHDDDEFSVHNLEMIQIENPKKATEKLLRAIPLIHYPVMIPDIPTVILPEDFVIPYQTQFIDETL